METKGKKEEGKKKAIKVLTFPVPFSLGEIRNSGINTKILSKTFKEEIINEAFRFHEEGNFLEATKYYQYFINQGFVDHRVFSNYGSILKDLGKLKEAELLTRKAIKINHII